MPSPLSIWGILPIKSLDRAKQRLCTLLTAVERKELMRHCVSDVLAEASKSSRLTGLLIVSKDPSVRKMARSVGAELLAPDSDAGQSHAIAVGVAHLKSLSVSATVTIPGDAPLITSSDIDLICDTLEARPSLTIVSNSDDTGSNCIGASPPDLIPYQFGRNSLARHVASARSAGIQPTILRLPRFELDVDTPADIAELMKQPMRTSTQRYLAASAIQ